MTTGTNMPILWQNCLMQYSTEIARKAWVWFAETRGSGMLYAADRYADQVEKLVQTLTPMVTAGFAQLQANHPSDAEVMPRLMRFILRRHANLYFGGNVRPPFLEDATAGVL